MWLLNTTSLTLEYYHDDRGLTYAILSHRWQKEEVLFADYHKGHLRNPAETKSKLGWWKVQAACRQAQEDKIQYIWIDACCINKDSTVELSEAINSMYRWYTNAMVCYAYLFDVQVSHVAKKPSFLESEWFERGWTLQELIAPPELVFYNCAWDRIGTRNELSGAVSLLTKIPEGILRGEERPNKYSIAQRMSWASTRKTLRAEDVAYSLMGLFEVNMSMLYGEGGEHAFYRLQKKIMKESADQTIFAWRTTDETKYHGLLAPSPAAFEDCRNVTRADGQEVSFQQTNLGLQLTLRACPYGLDVYLVMLDALLNGVRIGIFLGLSSQSRATSTLGRRICNRLDRLSSGQFSCRARQITIPHQPFPGIMPHNGSFGFIIKAFTISSRQAKKTITLSLDNGIHVIARQGDWHSPNIVSLKPNTQGAAVGFVVRDRKECPWVVLKLGLEFDFSPWVWAYTPHLHPSPETVIDLANHRPQRDSIITSAYDTSTRDRPREHQRIKPRDPDAILGNPIRDDGYFRGDRIDGISITHLGLRVKVYRSESLQSSWLVEIEAP